MNKNLQYLKYVLRHKYYVLQESIRLGFFWRGLVHDLSKFSPDEWAPYSNYFYGKYPSINEIHGDARNSCSLFKEDVEKAFNYAWLRHIHRNPHHWQYWILHYDNGSFEAMEMPEKYMLEMLADWRGAGRAINGYDETKNWYLNNRRNMILHENTRAWIEKQLGIIKEDNV